MGKNSNTYKIFNVNEKTPPEFYKQLDDEFHFNFDPCPLRENPEFNGLQIKWGGRTFINPPYGRQVRNWLIKGIDEIVIGNSELCVFLLPSYTDVKWFHEIVLPFASEIRFVKGRLKFGIHKESAPFGSMVVVFSIDKHLVGHSLRVSSIKCQENDTL